MKKIFLIILYSLSLFTVNAENISLKIKLGLNKGYEILIVDSKVEKLNLSKRSSSYNYLFRFNRCPSRCNAYLKI